VKFEQNYTERETEVRRSLPSLVFPPSTDDKVFSLKAEDGALEAQRRKAMMAAFPPFFKSLNKRYFSELGYLHNILTSVSLSV